MAPSDLNSVQVFNCGTDSLMTYEELCHAVAKVAGKTAKTSTYNPKDFDLPKGSFPFRNEEFAVSCDKAKSVRESRFHNHHHRGHNQPIPNRRMSLLGRLSSHCSHLRSDAFTNARTRTVGWKPTKSLAEDLSWYYKQYVDAGLDKKDIKFEADDMIFGKK